MVTTIKTKDGLISAFIEWGTVNADGSPNDKGKYIYVSECWVHEKARHKGFLIEMIARMFEESIESGKKISYEFVYFNRRKHGKISKTYCASHFLKHTRLNKLMKQEVDNG